MSRIALGLAVVGLLVRTAPVAGEPLPGFRQVAQSARVRFFTRADSRAGRRERDALRRTEAYLAQLEHRLGERLAEPIEYYRYERPEDIASQTGVYATGLTRVGDHVVHSTVDYHPHELVHAVAGRLGNPGRFFHEGLAVAIGDEGRWGRRGVHELARAHVRGQSWRSLSGAFDRLEPDAAYPLAGSFVLHLIETEGQEKLFAFFRACGTSPAKAALAFRTAYGVSLDDAVAAWQLRVLGGGRPGTSSSQVAVAAFDSISPGAGRPGR